MVKNLDIRDSLIHKNEMAGNLGCLGSVGKEVWVLGPLWEEKNKVCLEGAKKRREKIHLFSPGLPEF
jgi:hypothetical protein